MNIDRNGPLALVGSGEFLPVMAPIDAQLIDSRPARVAIVPTAAGLEGEGSVKRWLDLGVDHFRSLGAEVVAVRALDDESANNADHVEAMTGCGLIYYSGGDPSHAISTMRNSTTWDAVVAAWRTGAALAGCSAGAMMMGSVSASPRRSDLVDGLGLFADLCVLPHFDRLDQRPGMTDSVRERLDSDVTLLGIDENTAVVVEPSTGIGTVAGDGRAWLIGAGERQSFDAGQSVAVDFQVA